MLTFVLEMFLVVLYTNFIAAPDCYDMYGVLGCGGSDDF